MRIRSRGGAHRPRPPPEYLARRLEEPGRIGRAGLRGGGQVPASGQWRRPPPPDGPGVSPTRMPATGRSAGRGRQRPGRTPAERWSRAARAARGRPGAHRAGPGAHGPPRCGVYGPIFAGGRCAGRSPGVARSAMHLAGIACRGPAPIAAGSWPGRLRRAGSRAGDRAGAGAPGSRSCGDAGGGRAGQPRADRPGPSDRGIRRRGSRVVGRWWIRRGWLLSGVKKNPRSAEADRGFVRFVRRYSESGLHPLRISRRP